MAQVKNLKFNDNVLQVESSYTIDSQQTVNDPNIQISNVYLADHCGNLVFQSNTNSFTNFTIKSSCGTNSIKIGVDTDMIDQWPAIEFYDQGIMYSMIGVKCGIFTIADNCGIAQLSLADDGLWKDQDGYTFGVQSGMFMFNDPNGTNRFYISEHCGDTEMHLGVDGPILSEDQYGHYLKIIDHCGDNTIFEAHYDGAPFIVFPNTNSGNHDMWIGEYCGQTGIGGSYGCLLGLDFGRGLVYAGSENDYSSPNANSGFFVCSGIWFPEINGLKVGCGEVYVDSDGYLRASGFQS